MKKLLTFFFSLLLGILFCVGLFRYVVTWQEFKRELGRVSFGEWFVVVLFSFLCFGLAVWRWKRIAADLGFSVPFLGLFGPHLASFGIIYLIPVGLFWADLFRAKMLEKREGVPVSKGLATVFIDRLFNSVFNLLLIFSGLFIFFGKVGTLWLELRHVYLVVLLFTSFTLGLILAFVLWPSFLKRIGVLDFLLNSFVHKEGLAGRVRKEISLFFRKENFETLVSIVGFSLLRSFSLLFLSFFIVLFLGYPLPLPSVWALFGPTFASLETPISADLGSHDVTSAFVFEALGFKRGTGVAYALVFRGANLVLAAAGLSFLAKVVLTPQDGNG